MLGVWFPKEDQIRYEGIVVDVQSGDSIDVGIIGPPIVNLLWTMEEMEIVIDYLSKQFPNGYVIEGGEVKPFGRGKK